MRDPAIEAGSHNRRLFIWSILMDRVNGAAHIDIGGGRRGFIDEDLGVGQEGTEVTALWLNMVQEEILKVVEQAGLTSSEGDWSQLYQAIGILLDALFADVEAAYQFATTPEALAGILLDKIISPKTLADVLAAPSGAISKRFQNLIVVCDHKPNGTAGGTFTSGAWRTRDLNTIIADPQGLVAAGSFALAANRFTLGAGRWLVEASAPAMGTDGHKTRLYNITDAAMVAYGTTENATGAGTGDVVQTRSLLNAFVTIAAAKQFELQHIAAGSSATLGLGVPSPFGLGASDGPEVYSILRAHKLD
jgi:hypothetical protein